MSLTVVRMMIAAASLSMAVGCAHNKAAAPAPVAKAEEPTPAPAATPAPVAVAKPANIWKSKPVSERIHVEKAAIKIDDKIFFETGEAKIDAQSFELLDGIAKVLTENAQLKKVVIEGHTDNTGKAEVNKKISQARADAVLDYLVGKGVAKSRLEAKGFGSEAPVASNDTDEGRDQNRRVDFKIAQ